MKAVIIIPARHASSRFPGKPLCNILGKPMIAWVVEAAKKSRLAGAVVVATDHEGIASAAIKAGAEVVMTESDLKSGTDRVAAAALHYPAEVYINLQGDEPAVEPADLDALIEAFADRPQMATLCRPFKTVEDYRNPNMVKVVVDAKGRALYFSRSPIPYYRDQELNGGLKSFSEILPLLHVGIYGYTKESLFAFSSLPPSPLEAAESLEQLRALYAGWSIKVVEAKGLPGVGVDTPADVSLAEKILKERLKL